MLQKKDYYKLAYIYMKNPHDALDAMEDMILVLYENIHKLKKADAFYPWSKTILVNCCKKLIKNKNRIIPLDHITKEYHYKDIEKTEEKIDIHKYLNQLEKHHEEVIKLRYYMDLDYKSISEILKIPIGTVKSRISIGIKNLRKIIGGELDE
jgi:RNA polymerase sigma-70 factor, ECF subfamily